jgi:hypothetical protein
VREADFEQLVGSFLEMQSNDGLSQTSDSEEDASRPGRWLVSTLGTSLTCVGLGYRDAVWAQRYLAQIDTRSSSEMLSWDKGSARSWARRNVRKMSPQSVMLFQSWSGSQEPDASSEWESVWRVIVDEISWENVGFWGPGEAAQSVRLNRLKSMFVLSRLVALELGSHAAFSFMLGRNRALADTSPLLFISRFGPDRFEEALAAAAHYLEVGPWHMER